MNKISYSGYRFPLEIIQQAIFSAWLDEAVTLVVDALAAVEAQRAG